MLCVLGDAPVMVWVCTPVRPVGGGGGWKRVEACMLVYVCECMHGMVGDDGSLKFVFIFFRRVNRTSTCTT